MSFEWPQTIAIIVPACLLAGVLVTAILAYFRLVNSRSKLPAENEDESPLRKLQDRTLKLEFRTDAHATQFDKLDVRLASIDTTLKELLERTPRVDKE